MGSSRSIRRRDPNTLSNYDQFVTLHTTANLSIDFEQNVLFGNILLDVRVLVNPKENDLILDTSFLDVQDITVDGISSEWSFLPRTEPYGSALRISLENANEANDRLKVDVSLEDMLVFHEAMYLDSIVP
jgi:leukotriene-A4 hydrolase